MVNNTAVHFYLNSKGNLQMHHYQDIFTNTIFDKPILSIDDIADILICSSKTVRRMIARNEIPYRRIRGRVRFIRAEIVDWIDQGN